MAEKARYIYYRRAAIVISVLVHNKAEQCLT